MADEETVANQEEPQTSFRDRMRQRLSAEQSEEPETANLSTPESDTEEEETSERQPEEGETEELEAESTEEEADTDGAEPSEDPELLERVQKAEERARSMERDYRVKTSKIAEATRRLEDQAGVVKQQADFILGIAEQGVKQFDQVNWAQLQTKPEEYQRTKQMFEGAIMQRDQLNKQLGNIADQHKDMLERSKGREAEVSKDILKTTIDGWSNDLYNGLRAYAVDELSYTAEEFDDMTDWRRLRDIHVQYQLSQAPKQVVKLNRKKGKLPVKRQRERQQVRNSSGQFQKARQALSENPGDREARRTFFQEKLRAEREG